jgi:hypothetical protein
MRFFIQILTILSLGFIIELFLPWWGIALAAFVGGLAVRSNANFLGGFLAISILWIGKALLIEFSAATALAEKVSIIFPLRNTIFLFALMALLGGLVGGFAALTGSLIKKSS